MLCKTSQEDSDRFAKGLQPARPRMALREGRGEVTGASRPLEPPPPEHKTDGASKEETDTCAVSAALFFSVYASGSAGIHAANGRWR